MSKARPFRLSSLFERHGARFEAQQDWNITLCPHKFERSIVAQNVKPWCLSASHHATTTAIAGAMK